MLTPDLRHKFKRKKINNPSEKNCQPSLVEVRGVVSPEHTPQNYVHCRDKIRRIVFQKIQGTKRIDLTVSYVSRFSFVLLCCLAGSNQKPTNITAKFLRILICSCIYSLGFTHQFQPITSFI